VNTKNSLRSTQQSVVGMLSIKSQGQWMFMWTSLLHFPIKVFCDIGLFPCELDHTFVFLPIMIKLIAMQSLRYICCYDRCVIWLPGRYVTTLISNMMLVNCLEPALSHKAQGLSRYKACPINLRSTVVICCIVLLLNKNREKKHSKSKRVTLHIILKQ